MDKKIKRRWLQWLRTHRQTKMKLCRADHKGHCCMGGLARVLGYEFHTLGNVARLRLPHFHSYDQPVSVLPAFILAKAGLTVEDQSHLTDLNDRSGTRGFRLVIEYIKEKL